jgi:Rrf2 family transcriptional regulator, cysteine metabolism repressor
MRVSAKAEYACLAMLELAANYGEPQPVRVKAIAESHRIPLRFLVQILLQLKGAGLVASTRGVSGGYQLARPPSRISLADIVNIIDRAPEPRRSVATAPDSVATQALHGVWSEIQAEEQRLLEATTFAELVRRTQHSTAASYQI